MWGYCERSSEPELVLIGEAPGEIEELEGKPFVGPAGRMLRSGFSQAGGRPESVYMTNVIACRPPANNIGSEDARAAVECCRPGLLEEMEALKSAKAVIALGSTAKAALDPLMKRGYVYEVPFGSRKLPALTTFHPSYILRGAQHEEPTWVNDMARGIALATGGVKPLALTLHTNPSIVQIEEWTRRLVKAEALLGVDIETTGFRWKEARIIVVGIAMSPTEAFSIPFLKRGGESCWSAPSEMRAWKCLKTLLARCPTVFQNAPFDMMHLRNAGAPVKRLAHDLLLAHHAMSPELPHSLEYIASCFGSMPAWKGEVKDDPRRMLEMEDEQLRTYNLKDALALLQCLPPILKELEEDGLLDVYLKRSMPRVELVLELTDAGIQIDTEKLQEWKDALEERQGELEQEMRSVAKLPDGFSLTKGAHLRWLLFGSKPANLASKVSELEAYDEEGSRKKKGTKLHRELSSYVDGFRAEPFPRLNHHLRTTDTGLESLDDIARQSILIAINNRRSEIAGLKRPTPEHREEDDRLERYSDFIALYDRWQEVTKLLTTYTDPPIGPDGRIHPSYKIHGTATGRLSSSGPNLQNIPAHSELGLGFRRACVPRRGWAFTKADYSNMELRVLAYASGDKAMLDAFERGESLHDIHCRWFFPDLDEKSPLWKAARFATKKYNFGRLAYGGTARGIYEKLVVEVPALGLTFRDFMRIDKRCFDGHPEFVRYRERYLKSILQTRCAVTAFGRKRYLLGDDRSIEREGLNYPIQGTAGEIALDGQLALLKELRLMEPIPRIVVSDHDGIVVEHEKRLRSDVVKAMKRTLEAPVDLPLWGWKGVVFPIEIEASDVSWGDMEAYGSETEATRHPRRKTRAVR